MRNGGGDATLRVHVCAASPPQLWRSAAELLVPEGRRALTHGIAVPQQDAVGAGARLQTHVEGMDSIGVDLVLSHKRDTVRKQAGKPVC